MTGFIIKTKDNKTIRFRYHLDAAPASSAAFAKTIPFSKTFIHARVSGQEIWTDDAPALDIIQENASVFTEPGEIVIGPLKPERCKTAKCLGIYYGEGKGLDACNIFGKVFDEDLHLLKDLGESILRNGTELLHFELME
jgi:hypothetical protein